MIYVILIFAGLFLCNSIPHLASGLKGEPFPSPFSHPRGVGDSSPMTNFFWGASNLIAAILLILWRRTEIQLTPHWLVLTASFLLCGMHLSWHFGKVRSGKFKKK